MKFLISLTFVASSSWALAQEDVAPILEKPAAPKYSPYACKKSKAPLFKKDRVLNIKMMADHKKIHAAMGSSARGVLAIDRGEKRGVEFVPANIEARGKSRRQMCQFKPLKVKFLEEEKSQKIVSQTKAESGLRDKMPLDSPAKDKVLSQVYNSTKDLDLMVTSQEETIFDKIGDDVKLVTHCGKKDWFVGAPTPELQAQKLIAEYVHYKILSLFKTTTMSARLAKIDYVNPDGSLYESQWAMFRENTSAIAKRCEGLEKFDGQWNQDMEDIISRLHLDLVNNIFDSGDYSLYGHNVKHLVESHPQGPFLHYVPYDYDLGQVTDNDLPELSADPVKIYIEKIETDQPVMMERLLSLIDLWISKEDAVKEVIDSSPLEGLYLERFLKWHEVTFSELKVQQKRLK